VKRIVLASGSPRRRALLESLGLELEILRSEAEEVNAGEHPARVVERNAALKRDDVLPRIDGDALVIAADTLVFQGEKILGKPADREEAIAMLEHLSGTTHEVCTGIALADTGTGAKLEGSETTEVTFRNLSADEIERFVDVVNPVDRAGAYTVDGPGMLLVSGYRGCYQNVLGLPVARLDAMLRELGFPLFDAVDKDRAAFL